MAGGGAANEITLEYTPTWIVAAVCSVIVLISLFFDKLLHYLGKALKKYNQTPLLEALQKVKEELMLLGFISFLLAVFQDTLQKMCVGESLMHHWLPCKKDSYVASTTKHYTMNFFPGDFGRARRHLLAGGGAGGDYCFVKGKVPIISLNAIHQLHIFIFVLAITHVFLSAITIVLGVVQMKRWNKWESKIREDSTRLEEEDDHNNIMPVQSFKFIQNYYKGFDKIGDIKGWLHADDYTVLRISFINKHCKTIRTFNFYNYMIRALEVDFKEVVGISLYLWIVVMLLLLVNVAGSHAYFLISILPLIILLWVGAKLEHIIIELAHDVASKHTVIDQRTLVVSPSDEHFWFKKPKAILYLIHFILFNSAFQIAYFIWILTTHGIYSCFMDKCVFLVLRLVISVVTQILCSYSTLPLYAIISHMGSSFNPAIFNEPVRESIFSWMNGARNPKKKATETGKNSTASSHDIQLSNFA